jgi:hypothetical protein
MFRSVVVPGWGQWANGKQVKALVVAGGEGYLIFRAIDWGSRERAAIDPTSKEFAGARRRDFTWWSIFAGVLSMGDAYVDAQLGAFDVEFKPQDTSAPDHAALDFRGRPGGRSTSIREPAVALQAGLTLRFP